MKVSKERLTQIIKEETEKTVQKKSTDEAFYKSASGVERHMDDNLKNLIDGLKEKLGPAFLAKILDEMLTTWKDTQIKDFMSKVAQGSGLKVGGVEHYGEGLNTLNEEPYFASNLQKLLRNVDTESIVQIIVNGQPVEIDEVWTDDESNTLNISVR